LLLQLQLHPLRPRHIPVKRLLALLKLVPLFPFAVGVININELMLLNILLLIVFIINNNSKDLFLIKGIIGFNFH
jgi:hypothetical protein